MEPASQLRELPSVEELARSLQDLESRFPRRLIVDECRRALDKARQSILQGAPAPELSSSVRASLAELEQHSFRRVINATGVILHTNLGRAPLPGLPDPGGYSNLEYDLGSGKRGRRDAHSALLLERLLGAPGILVNNGAAAAWLALHELAAGGEVIISRGELIEIGDGFRIPDIMARTGARVVEVGTTNRTRVEDYRDAITPMTRLLMRVHPSNFRIRGFTGRPSLDQLSALARDRSIPLYEDLGSGCFVDLRDFGVDEPTAQASLAAGVDVLSFSGDKLLGGPQAGVLAGRADLIQRLRRNPMFRALRMDKMGVAAMETALRLLLLERWDELPVMRMIRATPASLKARAESLALRIPGSSTMESVALLGGGSTPDATLPSWAVVLPGAASQMEKRLRSARPPVIARIVEDRLLLDLRTVFAEDEPALIRAVLAALDA